MRLKGFLIGRPIIFPVVIWLFMIWILPSIASAGMSLSKGSDLMQLYGSMRDNNINKIKSALETKLVTQKLLDFGLSEDEVIKKISQLNDEQMHQMASLSDKVLAGGNGLGTTIAVLLLIILAIVILKLVGHEVVVK